MPSMEEMLDQILSNAAYLGYPQGGPPATAAYHRSSAAAGMVGLRVSAGSFLRDFLDASLWTVTVLAHREMARLLEERKQEERRALS